jgi:hypothetical protein
MELSSMKMNPKEKVNDFNQRFLMLKKKIPTKSIYVENFIIAYYVKALQHNTTMLILYSKLLNR